MPAWAKTLSENVDYVSACITDLETRLKDINAQLRTIGNVDEFGNRDSDPWTILPADGRPDPAPEWPFPTPPSDRELQVWEAEWRRPQAVQWETHGMEYDVALYVRTFCEAESPPLSAARLRLVDVYREDLGLSMRGLARHRWRIEPPSTRDRLSVVKSTSDTEDPT